MFKGFALTMSLQSKFNIQILLLLECEAADKKKNPLSVNLTFLPRVCLIQAIVILDVLHNNSMSKRTDSDKSLDYNTMLTTTNSNT